jgi:hypothetical protein
MKPATRDNAYRKIWLGKAARKVEVAAISGDAWGRQWAKAAGKAISANALAMLSVSEVVAHIGWWRTAVV